jgi:6-phosphogluconolactonase
VSETSVIVHTDAATLAEAVAERLAARLLDAQASRGYASVVLTGGRIADAVHRALAAGPARDSIDWSRVDFWWGDERFLPAGDPERNETQARAALLDVVPVDPARVHPMGASDGPDGPDPEAAAFRYAAQLAASAKPGSGELPHFDVLMLGVGEDGHIASIFPEHPSGYATGTVAAVHNSPKPPPQRITLTRDTVNSAEEVWLIASGAGKADAVGLAVAGAGPVQVPAAGAHGVARTLWLLDEAAAAHVPRTARSVRS